MVVTPSSLTNISIDCSGKEWKRQGDLEDASEAGYDDWKQGARRGAEFALHVMGATANVTICRITGRIIDTNPSTVCAASAFAIWNALNYIPKEAVTKTMESVVSQGWKRPVNDVPSITELGGEA